MSSRKRFVFVCVFLCGALSAIAQRRDDVLIFTDPGRRFSVEFPQDWQWTLVAPSGQPLAMFVQPKSEAAAIVERVRLNLRLEPNEITDTFADSESKYIRENQPKAKDIVATLTTRNGKRIVIVDYTRDGIGERERVRQYSFPVGQDLYRLTCMALQSRFARYESIFAAIADSLKSAEALGPGN
jgi:hypothetical protein